MRQEITEVTEGSNHTVSLVLLVEFPLQVSQKWGMPFPLGKSGGTTFPRVPTQFKH